MRKGRGRCDADDAGRKLPGGYPAPPDGWTCVNWARHLQHELAIDGRVKCASVRSMYGHWIEALYREAFDNRHGRMSPAVRDAIANGGRQ